MYRMNGPVLEGKRPSLLLGKWRVLDSSDGVGCGVLGSLDVEKPVLVAGLGLATRGGRHFTLRKIPDLRLQDESTGCAS